MDTSSLPYVAITICVIAVVLYRRFRPSSATTPRVHFIAQAAANIEGNELNAIKSSDSFDGDEYNYDVVEISRVNLHYVAFQIHSPTVI